jgi:putative hydrolase of the HAD superfamily
MSDRWPVHTVVLDLDDTLFAERDFVLGGFRAAGAWLEAERGIGGLAAEATRWFEEGERGKIFDCALASLGLAADATLVAGLVRAYREHRPALALCPDAAEFLAWAAPRFRLALVTDGWRDVQARKIAALGLEARIGCRVLTDALGREAWKPSPAGFERVAAELPGRADGFVYVGDNPRKDFLAPRALGWRTVRIRRAGGEHAGRAAAPAEAAEREIPLLTALRDLLLPGLKP